MTIFQYGEAGTINCWVGATLAAIPHKNILIVLETKVNKKH